MSTKIENSFVVSAPSDTAWTILTDLPRVVPCMPGAELTELIDERRFKGLSKVKVGPVELRFMGEGELYDIDRDARTSKLRAKGSDSKGRGTFNAEMRFALTPHTDGTLVTVQTDLTFAGSVAQYGRGVAIVKEMANQLTAQFAQNLEALIASERVEAPAAATQVETQPRPGVSPEPQPAPGTASVSGLGLLFRALRAMVARWLGFGR